MTRLPRSASDSSLGSCAADTLGLRSTAACSTRSRLRTWRPTSIAVGVFGALAISSRVGKWSKIARAQAFCAEKNCQGVAFWFDDAVSCKLCLRTRLRLPLGGALTNEIPGFCVNIQAVDLALKVHGALAVVVPGIGGLGRKPHTRQGSLLSRGKIDRRETQPRVRYVDTGNRGPGRGHGELAAESNGREGLFCVLVGGLAK